MVVDKKMAARGIAGDQREITDDPKIPTRRFEVNARIQSALAKCPPLFWLVARALKARWWR